MKVNKRKKVDRNPLGEEIEVEAFAEDGMVVVQFGDQEIVIDPEEADKLADMIAGAVEEATEEDAGEEDEEDE
jgi:antitoxin component of MazEF toxin-antitoxin module